MKRKYDTGQNKFVRYLALAAVCWALYTAVFDRDGDFSPTTEVDVIEYRITSALGVAVDETNRAIDDTNSEMQEVADGRERKNQKRIRRDTKRKKER